MWWFDDKGWKWGLILAIVLFTGPIWAPIALMIFGGIFNMFYY